MTDFTYYITVGVVLFFSSALHSAAGFGFALFAIPVLLLAGMQPFEAIALTAISVIIHGYFSVWRSAEKPPWGQVFTLVGIACMMQPFGAWLLSRILFLDRAQIGQIYGGILLAVLGLRAWLRPKPREHLPLAWGYLTMVASGLVSGLSGMGGPPIVLWLMAHKWSNERIRVMLWTIFATMAATNLFWQTLRFGEAVVHASYLGLLFAPLTLFGRIPGNWIAAKMSSATMRHVATTILVLVALYAMTQPCFVPSSTD